MSEHEGEVASLTGSDVRAIGGLLALLFGIIVVLWIVAAAVLA